MKTGVLLLFFTSLTPGLLQAQTDLESALGKGDIAIISSFLDEKVELTLEDQEVTLSKSEVEARLREFYALHPPKGYRQVHNGASKSKDSTYTIGELSTDNGLFRVYLYFTQVDQRRVIAELRIEK